MVVRLCLTVSQGLFLFARAKALWMSYVNEGVFALPVDALLIISVNRSNSFEEVMISEGGGTMGCKGCKGSWWCPGSVKIVALEAQVEAVGKQGT